MLQKNPHQVLAKVKGHELGQGEGGGNFEFEGVDEGPAVGILDLFIIKRESGDLEGFQVAIDGSNSGFLPFGDFGHSQPAGAGLDGPNDSPLPG